MNILLSIGLLLQIYIIYRTPTHTAGADRPVSYSDYFQRGLRKTLFLPPIPKDDPLNKYVGESEDFPLRTDSLNQEGETPSGEDQYQIERARRQRNWLLYGTAEDGSVQENNQQQIPAPWDDDDSTPQNATTKEYSEPPFQYSKYNYSLPAKRTNWTLPTQPKPTNESNIAVVVLSGRSNFERRQTIRETWGKGHENIYFILGGPEPDNQQDMDWSNVSSTSNRLFQEQREFGDILDTVHPDSYKGLPYKLHFAICWISGHPRMKHIQWVLKVDDDVVVRINTMQYHTLRHLDPARPMVVGRMEPNSKPHRTGKWAEDPKWVGIDGVDEYPPWAYGSTGYVMSRPVVDFVASQQQSIYYYQGEDVSLGIWLYESPLDVSWFDSPDFNLFKEQWVDHATSAVIGHNLDTNEMNLIFEKWKDPKLLNEPFHVDHVKVKGNIYTIEKSKPPALYEELDEDYSMYWETEEERNNRYQYIPATEEEEEEANNSRR